ncbi:MAG: dihydrofolate reductase [Bacteroidales bacterium]|jgi:dihydrofolate reductase|nr:dihydrofolate reductase [Bacteroidales bacterium]
MLSIIAAVSENNIIGTNNKLPWHLPADLKYFKNTTMGHMLIMGRKTFESFGKPLPGRHSIVITRQENWFYEGVEVAHSLDEAIIKVGKQDEIFIIGGAEIFKQALPFCNKMYLTIIHHNFEGDTSFPPVGFSEWKLVKDEKHQPDDKNPYPYSFRTYIRKKKSLKSAARAT